jgi:hypothetical protein
VSRCGPPKRAFSVRFSLRIPAKFTVGALLAALFGQFPSEVPRIYLSGTLVNNAAAKRAGYPPYRSACPPLLYDPAFTQQ